ncbi:MAG TPA: hypothetical protein DD477_12030 [Spirochaetaceae bacterium]|nr:hypothetical protein [Spirochaetaceae bacterium]HAW87021.1 hypothetical protein [Spirochaetaceae bacterium]HAX38494.1 hypothetical protein [Spirochaetaceae bacterium]HBO41925.1 hypothetical protein [Spirochaetaceae bacterium]HCQ88385.1 hypothetical protein [Spirochaetaceae bacterium]
MALASQDSPGGFEVFLVIVDQQESAPAGLLLGVYSGHCRIDPFSGWRQIKVASPAQSIAVDDDWRNDGVEKNWRLASGWIACRPAVSPATLLTMNPIQGSPAAPVPDFDASDPAVCLFAKLRDRDYASQGWCVLEGRIVIEKALASGLELVALLTVPADADYWRQRLAGGSDVALRVLARPAMEQLVGFAFHRGALALARRPALGPACLPALGPKDRRVSLALWQVGDPDNLGALIRSAAALGGAAVFLGPGCADPYGRKALRASMGCTLSLPLYPVVDLAGLRAGLTAPAAVGSVATGPRLVAAALSPVALQPGQVVSAGDTVLLLGNEGWGLPPELVTQCDAVVCIPMASGVDSLNVAAAGAILLWELCQAHPAKNHAG